MSRLFKNNFFSDLKPQMFELNETFPYFTALLYGGKQVGGTICCEINRTFQNQDPQGQYMIHLNTFSS